MDEATKECRAIPVALTYETVRRFDDRFIRMEAALKTLVERDPSNAELIALRAENAQLKADIAGAVDATDQIEQGAREGLPAAPQ